MARFQNPSQIPLIEDCFNTIPTLHVIHLAIVIKLLIEKKSTDKYIVAIDKSLDKSL
jgi:hypothetical protein